jgi:hypothetical protein
MPVPCMPALNARRPLRTVLEVHMFTATLTPRLHARVGSLQYTVMQYTLSIATIVLLLVEVVFVRCCELIESLLAGCVGHVACLPSAWR